jgi:predicted protein tyrosine phosphatase
MIHETDGAKTAEMLKILLGIEVPTQDAITIEHTLFASLNARTEKAEAELAHEKTMRSRHWEAIQGLGETLNKAEAERVQIEAERDTLKAQLECAGRLEATLRNQMASWVSQFNNKEAELAELAEAMGNFPLTPETLRNISTGLRASADNCKKGALRIAELEKQLAERDGLKAQLAGLGSQLELEQNERDAFAVELGEVKAQLESHREQLWRICKEAFDLDHTIGGEPADDYVIRMVAALKAQLEQRVSDYLNERHCCSGADCGCMGVSRLGQIVGEECGQRITTLRTELAEARKALVDMLPPAYGVHGGPLTCMIAIYEDGTNENSARHRGVISRELVEAARKAQDGGVS